MTDQLRTPEALNELSIMNLEELPQAMEHFRRLCHDATNVSHNVAIIPLPDEPDGYYGLVTNDVDGVQFEVVNAKPRHRNETLLTIDQVQHHIARIKERDNDAQPAVYYDDTGVIIIHDDAEHSRRRDRTTIGINASHERVSLYNACDRELSQKDLVKFLRVRMEGCRTDSSDQLLRVARVISSKVSATAHGKQEHGRESLGRDLEAEVISDVGEIPEDVTFDIPWCTDPALQQRYIISVAVDLDPQTMRFELSIIPASEREATDDFREALDTYLNNSAECPVFHGNP